MKACPSTVINPLKLEFLKDYELRPKFDQSLKINIYESDSEDYISRTVVPSEVQLQIFKPLSTDQMRELIYQYPKISSETQEEEKTPSVNSQVLKPTPHFGSVNHQAQY